MLDAGTKGTGAEMVPLDRVLKMPGSSSKEFVPPKPRPRSAAAPAKRRPRRFKVVDVASGRVLVEHVGVRAAVDALASARRTVDVRVYVWQPRARRWRLLTIAEQKAMMGLAQAAT